MLYTLMERKKHPENATSEITLSANMLSEERFGKYTFENYTFGNHTYKHTRQQSFEIITTDE